MFLDSLCSLIIIVMLAFSLFRIFKLNPAVTPFVAVTAVVAWVSLFSMIDLLNFSIGACYVLVIGLFLFALRPPKQSLGQQDAKEALKAFFTPAVIMFIVACVFMLVVLAVQQPVLSQ